MHSWSSISIHLSKMLGPIGAFVLMAVAYLGVRRRRLMHAEGTQAYQSAITNDLIEPVSLHPHIDAMRCTGCTACVKACPEGEILQIVKHRAVLVEPNKCVGHGQCEVACPFGAIDLVFGTKKRGMELPRVSSDYETNVRGLYIAGELGGMGLIRNAVRQGKLAAQHALGHISTRAKTDVDLLIVGAGSAGLSAALVATQMKRPYLCIEQNSVGGTIYNFPRQKIVMTQPAELALVGKLEFPRNKVSKEQLLAYWSEIRKRYQLKIREQCKFISLKKDRDIFLVETSAGVITAKKVILCMGLRGSPRKLGVPGEESSKVTYNLIEPEQYQGMDIAIVGGGNAAAEATHRLAEPRLRNRVTLLVRTKAFNRANQENIDKANELAAAKKLKIMYETNIVSIHPQHVVIEHLGKPQQLRNNFVFIFAGAEMPFAFLQSLGIEIEKKFGEKVKKS